MDFQQLDLFSDIKIEPVFKSQQPQLKMSADALMQWKTRIFEYQQQLRTSELPVQQTLFDLAPTHADPNTINPFDLKLEAMSFYRMPTEGPGEACLYFVLDSEMPLILYIGETCQSNKRWKGTHDTKRYLDNYVSLHRQWDLKTAINIAFWWDAPTQTKPRQQLESSLIGKWRSPYNKENWEFWGMPFS